jgi:gamma-glutamyltranspeptidase/glutathione hydrolase
MDRRGFLLSTTAIAAASCNARALGASPAAASPYPEEPGPVDLSPAKWPTEARARAEQQEFFSGSWAPRVARSVHSKDGVISATVSPISVEAGLQALRQGGNAADAAVTVALTQICTQLGSVVSYAGIMSALYFDAKTGKISSLDGGWNSYRNETSPMTIPPSDLSLLKGGPAPAVPQDPGRQTLVPGFMACAEALHAKFGRLNFDALFAPALWYADHGVTVTPVLAWYFNYRKDVFARTPEGQNFLCQAGNSLPQYHDVFRQPELAKTLRAVAKNGAQEMYTGDWAKAFVAAVQQAGGKAELADLAEYHPIWSDPATISFGDHDVYVAGPPNNAAYQILTALNMASAMKLDERGPYWQDPVTFRDLTRIIDLTCTGPKFLPQTEILLRERNVGISPQDQLSPEYAAALAAAIPELFADPPETQPHHSNAIVVVDKEGNIAAVTHTINTVIWGDTGIVVGGIPIADAAGFQQRALAMIPSGSRLPNAIIDSIILNSNRQPVLATASIGSALFPETLRTIVSVYGQKLDLATVAAAPPLLLNLDPKAYLLPLTDMPVKVPDGAYNDAFIEKLQSLGVHGTKVAGPIVAGERGTLAMVAIDAGSNEKTALEVPGIMVWAGTET